MKFNAKPGDIVTLPAMGTWPATVHRFDEKSILAVRTSLAAQRPLLVRGEPGSGKSQLARAAAHVLKRAFFSEVVNPGSESRDLQYEFDAVARLAEAQARGASGHAGEENRLDPLRFLKPGILWWTFNWDTASGQDQLCVLSTGRPDTPREWRPGQGTVLLIDEIDKAESDLPNGLLETLGNGSFTVPYRSEPVKTDTVPPLVFITTNEERELPAAFLRRCLVLHLDLPEKEHELVTYLTAMGKIHFDKRCSPKVCREAASQLWRDRKEIKARGRVAPGQAEYLDLLRALCDMAKTEKEQLGLLERISQFAFLKQPPGG